MPLSAVALCWKKIIHGVTVAPIVEATQQQDGVEAAAGKRARGDKRLAGRAPARPGEDGGHQEEAVEDGQAEGDALPAPVAMAALSEDHQQKPEQHGDPGRQVEVGQTDAQGDELGDQGHQVGEHEVAGVEPAPDLAVALETSSP